MTTSAFSACPLQQLDIWLKEATSSNEADPMAFALATADASGQPSVRTLLFKGVVQPQGQPVLSFYSNTCSQKGQDLAANPRAEMLFYWPQLYRQLRVAGEVILLSREQTEAYFASRPRGSQISALASQQGQPIRNRQELLQRIESLHEQYADAPIPCPQYWQGYALLPKRFEFWVGQKDRLHDRFVYTKSTNESWMLNCLAP